MRQIAFAAMFLCVSTLMSRAEMRDVPPPDPLESQALLLADRAADVPPEAQNVPGRRVRPPVPGQGRLINVQIDPEEQARFLAALPIFPQDQPRPAIAVDPSVSADPDAETAFPWFWASVSPSIHDASPGRLELATSGLLDMGTGAAVPTPRLQSMQAIAEEHGADILRATIGTRVSPALVLAVIGIESAGRIDAVSHKGATGLMQLMPATAERFGVSDITDPAENIKGGVAYLDWLMEEFMGDPMMVLAAYNAGEGAVVEHGGVPPYRETRDYVPKVLAAWTVARGLCVTPPELLTDGCVFTVHTAGL